MSKRIQFDISDELWERSKKYIRKEKLRHDFGHTGFEELVTRREGRDKKYRIERLLQDKRLLRPIIQNMIEKGELVIK